MKITIQSLTVSGLSVLILLSACAPKATPTGPSQADQISTRAAELASMMLTQTVAAYSPTPPPTRWTPTALSRAAARTVLHAGWRTCSAWRNGGCSRPAWVRSASWRPARSKRVQGTFRSGATVSRVAWPPPSACADSADSTARLFLLRPGVPMM